MQFEAAIGNVAKLVAGLRPGAAPYDADIIILSLNRLADTQRATQSALAQRGISFHVIVLDQGSPAETVRTLARTFSQASNFSLYTVEKNLGVAGGRNLATSLGHGQIVVSLDNDAIFYDEWVVARAARSFMKMPSLGALGFNILNADGISPDEHSWGYPAKLLPRFMDQFETTTFVGAGHAIRRVTWNSAGGYDPALFFTWEEYDFCLAAIARGWRIRYDGSLAVIHKVSPEARVRWGAERTSYFVRNRLIIARKWGVSRPALAPRILGYLLKSLLNGSVRAAVDGIRQALCADVPKQQAMPKSMRHYLFANETRHRGSWVDRLLNEVFRRPARDPDIA